MAAEPGKPIALFEYVYLLHEREFLNSGRQLYKIGRTSQSPNDRFDDYPKGSCVVFYLRVPDSKASEKAIKAAFKIKFKQDRDIGQEYFEGDVNEMTQTLFFIATKMDSVIDENEKLKISLAETEKKWSDARDASKEILSRFTAELKDVLDPKTKKKKEEAVVVKEGEGGETSETKTTKAKGIKKKVEEGETGEVKIVVK
jgi:hypothetical protein